LTLHTATLERLKKEEGKIRIYGIALVPDISWQDDGLTTPHDERYNIAQQLDPELIWEAECVPHASGLLDAPMDMDKHFTTDLSPK
jgi:hypothetical protein